MKQFNIHQKFYEGDLCVAKGYGNRVWSVVGYTKEQSYLYGKYEEAMIYNLVCVINSEHIIEEQKDMTLVCRATYAYDYIRQLDDNGNPPTYPVNKTGKERKDVKKQDKINLEVYEYPDTKDGLLEELADLLSIVDLVGEDEKLQRDINVIKFKLKKFKK